MTECLTLDQAARDAIEAFEELANPLIEAIALIRELVSLPLPQVEQDLLVHTFTDLATELRRLPVAAMFQQALVGFRGLRDRMREATPRS